MRTIIAVFRKVSNLQLCFTKAQHFLRDVGSPGTFPDSRSMKTMVKMRRKIQLARIVPSICSMSWSPDPLHFTAAVKFILIALSFSVGGQRKAKVRTSLTSSWRTILSWTRPSFQTGSALRRDSWRLKLPLSLPGLRPKLWRQWPTASRPSATTARCLCVTHVKVSATAVVAWYLDFKHLRLTSQTVPKVLGVPIQ